MRNYLNASGHALDVGSAVLGPDDVAHLDPEAPEVASLIEEGALIEADEPPKSERGSA